MLLSNDVILNPISNHFSNPSNMFLLPTNDSHLPVKKSTHKKFLRKCHLTSLSSKVYSISDAYHPPRQTDSLLFAFPLSFFLPPTLALEEVVAFFQRRLRASRPHAHPHRQPQLFSVPREFGLFLLT
jgi:hypothetical protein